MMLSQTHSEVRTSGVTWQPAEPDVNSCLTVCLKCCMTSMTETMDMRLVASSKDFQSISSATQIKLEVLSCQRYEEIAEGEEK